MVQSVACCGCEVWLLKTEEQRKLSALEMDYLRRSARVTRLQKKKKKSQTPPLGAKYKQINQF